MLSKTFLIIIFLHTKLKFNSELYLQSKSKLMPGIILLPNFINLNSCFTFYNYLTAKNYSSLYIFIINKKILTHFLNIYNTSLTGHYLYLSN